MSESIDYIRLVREAQFGDKVCLERLSEIATVRLRAHVYRLTLRDDLTQDIVQESILEMIRILGKLKRPDRFWPWLYGIALNKLRRHRRTESRHNVDRMQEAGFGGAEEDKQEALEKLLAEELRQAVSKAMGGIKERHRAVLSMRCYDNMSYAEIAAAMGCSEFGAQMLFCRAKKSLGRQLARNGLSKGSLVTALVVFGKMTAANEAAAAEIAVTGAMMNVGATAAMVATAASKTAVTTLAAAGVVSVGAILMQGGGGVTGGNIEDLSEGSQVAGDVLVGKAISGQCLFFFPEGAAGAVMTRQMTEDESHCVVLENEHANYYYEHGRNTVYIRNRREYGEDMRVRRLPTDSASLKRFLDDVEGQVSEDASPEYVPGRGKGLFVVATETEGLVTGISRVDRHENLLEEEYFQFAWPQEAAVFDGRDTMHKRGWTYFAVEGRVGEKLVYGRGRIPFVYAMASDKGGWIELDVGGDKRYLKGDSMRGLARPWMGLHTIDTVRRDAAASGMRFSTELSEDRKEAKVTVRGDEGILIYTVDMEKDVIDRIDVVAGEKQGHLVFSYLQEIKEEGRFVQPRGGFGETSSSNGGGAGWLLELCE